VKRLGLHGDAATDGVFLSLFPLHLFLEELEVCDVTGETDDGRLVNGDDSLQVWKSGQAPVGSHRVGGDDHAILVLDGEDGGTGGDRSLRVSDGFAS